MVRMTADALLIYAAHSAIPTLRERLPPIPHSGITETISIMKNILTIPQLGTWSEDAACPTIAQCIRLINFLNTKLM
jgi:hypothetical protein